jgi:tripartite-type tricarboxylate transporter receptor subunit TctC
LSLIVLVAAPISFANAQSYPSRPVKIIVPFPAGGSADTLARLLGQALSEKFGQSFVIENRTGAGGNLGTDNVAKASPDGYTLLLTPSSIAIAPALYAKLPFDVAKDFTPVSLIGSIPMVIVINPKVPANTLQELIALAKSKPGQINYASAGFGSTNHLAVEMFKAKLGIDLAHVPYRGNPVAVLDVIGGQVSVFFDFVLTGAPHVREGKVRALAVTSPKRSPVLPDVPTVAEAGVNDFEAGTWFGVYAPAGMPKDIIDLLDGEFRAALASPTVKSKLEGLGVNIMGQGPEKLAALTRDDLAIWGPVIQKAGIKLGE